MSNIPTSLNNPGDLKNIGQPGAQQGMGGFASFGSPQEGFGALLNDLQSKINNHPDRTLADFANQYAPESDGNNSAQYAADLANQLKVSPATKIGSLQSNIGQFAEAVAHNEGYKPPVPQSENTQPSANSSNPGWGDWLLGGLTAAGGFFASTLKNLGPSIGAGIGEEVGGPTGAIAGGSIANSLLGAIGLGGTQTDTGNVSSNGQQPLDSSLQAEMSALEQQQPQLNKAAKSSYDTAMSTLGGTIGGRNLMNDQNVQEGMQTAALFGLAAPKQVVNGGMNYQPNMQEADKLIGEVHDLITQAEHASGTTAPMQEVIMEAQKNLERMSPTEMETVQKRLQSLGSGYLQKFGDGKGNIGTGHLLQAAVTEGRGKKYGLAESSTHKEVDKQFALAARRVIRKHTKNKDLYNRATKYEQNLINAKKVMKNLNGKRAPIQNKNGLIRNLLHRAGQSIAVAIGDKIGGIPGAIIGSMIGDAITGKIDRKYSRNVWETPAMHKALQILQHKSPVAFERVKFELKKQGIAYPATKAKGKVKHAPSRNTKEIQHPQSKPHTKKSLLKSTPRSGKPQTVPLKV